MSKFKVGDIIVGNAKANRYTYTRQGVECKVISVSESTRLIEVELMYKSVSTFGRDGFSVYPDCFDLVRTPHVHAEVIKKFAEGYPIQVEQRGWATGWSDVQYPRFDPSENYRVKPEKTPNQIEKEEIEQEMQKLKDRLAKLEVE